MRNKKEKNLAKTKKGLGTIGKFVVGTICCVVGLVGIIVLGLYLSGNLTNAPKDPEDLFFANVSVSEEGEKTYTSRGSDPYNVGGNVELIVSSATEGVNQMELELSFPRTQSKTFLALKSEEDEIVPSPTIKFFRGYDEDGNLLVFYSCSEENATHITNGIVVVPRYAKINTYFTAVAVVAPENVGDEVDETTKLYNIGGYTQLIASSVSAPKVSSTSTYINIDVAVDTIEIVGITGDSLSAATVPGLNEFELTINNGKVEVGCEGLFSAILNVTPARAIYKYGKDGTNGTKEFKKVIFALDNDVNNSGIIINFANSNNEAISSSTMEFGKQYSFDGKDTIGTGLLTTNLTGTIKLYARMFKSSLVEDEALTSGTQAIGDYDSLMRDSTKGVGAEKEFLIKEIPISGFEVSEQDRFNNGSPLELDINYSNIIYANNKDALNNLGILINSTQGTAQNNIKNILLSIQFYADGQWHDATIVNTLGTESVPKFFDLYSGHTVVTGLELGIDETNSLFGFNFYRPIYLNASNLSYWEIIGLPSLENLATYGISSLRIGVYYLSPDSGLILDDEENYGPYYVDCMAGDVVVPNLEWQSSEETKTNQLLGTGEFNERVFVSSSDAYSAYNSISIENLAKISNLSQNPTYKAIKYFVSTTSDVDLTRYLNVKKYEGTISGVSGSIYEIDSAFKLTVKDLDIDEIQFNIIFAVVETNPYGAATLYGNAYRIISLPTHGSELVYAPIRIQRALTGFELEVKEGTRVYPYGVNEEGAESLDLRAEKVYFLQKTENNIEIAIKIAKNDENLFKTLAKAGNFQLINNSNLYVKLGSIKVDLADSLVSIFAVENPLVDFADVISRFEEEETVSYVLKLSTNEVSYGENEAEKQESVSATYEIISNNLPAQLKLSTKTSEVFQIYSGKIREANFGEEGQEITEVDVDKVISEGGFDIDVESIAILQEGGKYYLSVFVKEFGFNDSYVVSSSNPEIVALNWEGTRYSISFLKAGTSTLTLTPSFAHSDYVSKTLTINVTSNYETEVMFPGTSATDERIISYDTIFGYQIMGSKSENVIYFRGTTVGEVVKNGLIKIIAKQIGAEGDGLDITSLFTFSPQIDTILTTGDNKKIEIVNDENFGLGIKFIGNFGSAATISVSASSFEVGQTFNFNITIKSFYELKYDIPGHDGAEAGDGEIGVYAESNITPGSFGFMKYDYTNKSYSSYADEKLYFFLNGTLIEDYENDFVYLDVSGSTFNSIKFKNVLGSFTLKISNSQNPTQYDLVKEIKFNVSSNIKVEENSKLSFENGKYYVNNELNPILNGEEIEFDDAEFKLIFGNTEIEAVFKRIRGAEAFASSVLINGEEESSFLIENVKKFGTQEITIAYGEKEFTFVFYVAPNIVFDDWNSAGVEKVTYNGKTYISLYAGQAVGSAANWFLVEEGKTISAVKFGEIEQDNKILNLPRLYAAAGLDNIQEDGVAYKVVKTEDGFITTQIVVYVGEGDDLETRIFDVIVTPFNWSTFLNFYDKNGNEIESVASGGKTYNKTDINAVLDGLFKTTILSGNTLQLDSTKYCIKQFKYFLTSQSNRMTYKLFRNGVEIASVGGEFSIDPTTLEVSTQPVANDMEYVIQITYVGYAAGYEKAEYVFNYPIKVIGTQKIDINYPHGESDNHIIYFDQFSNSQYEIDLGSTNRNYIGKTYANVAFKNGITSDVNAAFNKLHFALATVKVDDQDILESAFANYIEVSDDGKVVIKQNSANKIEISISVSTINGATATYKILAKSRNNDEMKVSYKGSALDNVGSEIKISNNFNVNGISFDIENKISDLEYVIVDEKGVIQNGNNMIYLNGNKVVVKSSPNQQSAILVVYNKELGTVAEIKLVAESPIVIEFNEGEPKDVYGDSTVDVRDWLKITVDGEEKSSKAALDWAIEITSGADFATVSANGYILNIVPVASGKTISGKISIWGGSLDGASKENPCIKEFELNVNPRIIAESESGTTDANENYTIDLVNKMFTIKEALPDGTTSYKYTASIVWNGETGESLAFIGDYAGVDFSGSESITLQISHISSTRIATIKVVVAKFDEDGNQIGESVTSTFTLTITPALQLAVTYPDYGTGVTFNKEAVYVGQQITKSEGITEKDKNGKTYKAALDLTENERIEIKGKTDLSDVIFKVSANCENYIGVTKAGLVYIKDMAKDSSQNISVSVDVVVKDTDIILGAYNLILSPTKVLTVTFPEAGNDELENFEIEIPNTQITSGGSVFQLKDGKIKVEMKQGTLDFGTVSFEVFAKQKYSYYKVESKVETVYAIGDVKASLAKLFILGKNKVDTPTGVASANILGVASDDEIFAISGGEINFKKAGIWPIQVVCGEEVSYYYVKVVEGKTKFTATYYEEIGDAGELAFETIFGNISNKDMYEFGVSASSENTVGLETIQSLEITQPSSNITFAYTVGNETYVIPFETATGSTKVFKNVSKKLINVKYTEKYNTKEDISIKDCFGNVVGVYSYTIKRDYKFDEKFFEEITPAEGIVTGDKDLNEYESDEWEDYSGTQTVSKTIELVAGTTYDLVRDLLITELGMTKFDGTAYKNEIALSLEFGNYVSNAGFEENKSGLISITAKSNNTYEITPHGAKNGGDIIHLILSIGTGDEKNPAEVYVLRILIMPNVKIQSLSVSGDTIVNSAEVEPGEVGETNVKLSDLIQTENIETSKLSASVVANNSANYVTSGSGSNRIKRLNSDGNGLENFGISLKTTQLGGAQIKIIITDEYGYQVTDASGEPIVLTLHYKKSDGSSVQLNKAQSATEIYEGESFEIWAVYTNPRTGDKTYSKYNGTTWDPKQDNAPSSDGAIILIDNITFPTDENFVATGAPSGINVSIAQSETLTAHMGTKTPLLNTTNNTINYVKNTFFSEEKISGNNFVITVVSGTETISFEIATTVKQRYKLTTTDPYNKYSTIYIPIYYNEGSYVIDKTQFANVASIFQLYDNKAGDSVDMESSPTFSSVTANDNKDFKVLGASVSYINKLVQDGAGVWEGTYKVGTWRTVSGGAKRFSAWTEDNTLSFNYQYVMQYVDVDTSNANIYTSYGMVIAGDIANVTAESLSKAKLLDYYGRTYPISAAYTDLGEDGKAIGNGETVIVNFYGDSHAHDGSLIKTLNVHRARYSGIKLTDGVESKTIVGTTELPFSSDGSGWGDLIKATPGATDAGDSITGSIGGLFSYDILIGDATINYDNTAGAYKIVVDSSCSSIMMGVNYMSISLGVVKFTKESNQWTISLETATVVNYYNSEFDENDTTLTLKKVPINTNSSAKLYIPLLIKGKEVRLADTIENIGTWGYIIFVSTANEPTGEPASIGGVKYSKVDDTWHKIVAATLNNQSATSAGTTTVYYKFGIETYYTDSNCTSTLNSKTESEKVVYEIIAPTKTGYTFGGYFTKENTQYIGENKRIVNKLYEVLPNQTLYAKWTANKYKVTFEANGGSISTDEGSVSSYDKDTPVTYDSTYGTLPTPTRTGYEFAGWFTAADGGTQVTEDTIVKTKSDHSLYAHWTANKYHTLLNSNSANSAGTTDLWYYFGTATYYTDEGCTNAISKINVPNKTGYHLTSYSFKNEDGTYTQYIDSNGNILDNLCTVCTDGAEDMEIRAMWRANDYTVSLDGQSGTQSISTIYYTYNSKKYYSDAAHETQIESISIPTRTGYAFGGYFTGENGEGTQYIDESGNFVNSLYRKVSPGTLYAKWTIRTYIVTFNANGGSVTTESKEVTWNSTYGDLPTPTRSGYDFKGWYTAATGGSRIYSSTYVTIIDDQTLYAQWTARTYTVTFDYNYSGTVSTTAKVTFGSAYGTLPSPKRDYYTFNGWYTAEYGGYEVTSDTIVSTDSDHTLYAHWKEIKYTTVTLMVDDTVYATIKIYIGQTGQAFTGSKPTQSGKTFRGWYHESTNMSVKVIDENGKLVSGAQNDDAQIVLTQSNGTWAYTGSTLTLKAIIS